MCNIQSNCVQTYTGIPPNRKTIYVILYSGNMKENNPFQIENMYWGVKIVNTVRHTMAQQLSGKTHDKHDYSSEDG